VANFTGKIQRNGFAPFRFLTLFPLRSSRRLRNSARQPFHFEPDVRVISISTRLILSRKNGEKMGPGSIFCYYALKLRMSSFVQNGAWPHFFLISSASLDERFGKAKSSKSLHPFLCILPTLFGRELIYQAHRFI
jgi:hypothetical protein